MNVHTVRRFNRFLFAAMILLQCCFTIVIWKERVLPSTDLATDTTEAIQMLQTHQFWQNSSAAIYPHNRMHILILYFYYRILSCMRIYQYWEASILLALFCIDVSVFFSCKIIRLLSGVRTELVFLLFCFLNPVTYLGLAYYYTSIISLPFMMISSYCIVKLIQERENKHWSIYAFLCGFFSAFGLFIRVTAVFPFLAYIVYLGCTIKKEAAKRTLLTCFFVSCSFGIMILCCSSLIRHYDPYDRSQTGFPVTHGIMMSMQGQGGYCQSDVDDTASLPSREKKIEGNLRVIKQRLTKMGIPGFFLLLGNKIKFNWSEGHSRFTNWYSGSFRYISGERRDVLILYSQILRILLWLFILVHILYRLYEKSMDAGVVFLVVLLGAFVLHMLTESNPQYSIPFLWVMMISAAEGCSMLLSESKKVRMQVCKRWKEIRSTGLLLTVCVVVFFIEYSPNFTQSSVPMMKTSSAQTYRRGNIAKTAADHLTLKQSFTADLPFNTLQVGISKLNTNTTMSQYNVKIVNRGKVLYEHDFGAADADDSGRFITFSFYTIKPDVLQPYEIIIEPASEAIADSLAFCMENHKLDYALDGELFVNGEEMEDCDLVYIAGYSYHSPIYGKKGYAIVCIGIFIVCIFCLGIFVLLNRCRESGMLEREFDKIIIGGGLYGLYAALLCGRSGQKTVVLEYDKEPFMRATYINQARVHMGYHYPRSYSTAIKSAHYFERFHYDYKDCIYSDFEQIYAISADFSWSNAQQFQKFCKASGIPCMEAPADRYFKKGMCEGAFLTQEYTYDAMLLKKKMLQQIAECPNIELHDSVRIRHIKEKSDHYAVTLENGQTYMGHFVLNATYACVNQILDKLGYEPFQIKYELCEIILCKAGEKLKGTGLTVMDGPFFSIMPFGKTGYHSLTSVTFTPHRTSFCRTPEFPCQSKCSDGYCSPLQLGNCNDCSAKPDSAWPYMSGLARKYMRDDLTFAYEKSLFSMKPILKAAEIDDSRPTVIKVYHRNPTFVSVLSGKINTVYDLDEVLLHEAEET